MGRRLLKKARDASKPVLHTPEEEKSIREKSTQIRKKAIQEVQYEELEGEATAGRKSDATYVHVELTGSKGQRYRVAVPKSYERQMPKKWEWTAERLKVAEALALGVPISVIAEDPEYKVNTRLTIYGWLQHPEFNEHVRGLVLETGWANQQERLAGLNRIARNIFGKLERELEGVPLTDKSIGALLTALPAYAKMIAQEKGEYVETQRVEQNTTLSANVAVGVGTIEEVLNNAPDNTRAKLDQEFDAIGDSIIRSITGEK